MTAHDHRRAPDTTLVRIDHLKIDPRFRVSKRWTNAFIALQTGKAKIALTRLPASSILPGYFERRSDKTVEHVTNLRPEHVPKLKREIKGGLRPSINLLWDPLAPGAGAYTSAEDEVTLAAYQALAIAIVPCRIIRPRVTTLDEAAVWLKERDGETAIAKTVAANPSSIPTYFGQQPIEPSEALKLLEKLSRRSATMVKKFHRSTQNRVHYHEMLFTICTNHADLLNSIRVLIQRNRSDHAQALMRMAYEAFLNFYLDWLSPQVFGPRFQLLSKLRRQKNSQQDPELAGAWSSLQNFPGLMENAADKARLSPFGSRLHDPIYAPLSSVVHQTYHHLEAKALPFEQLGNTSRTSDNKWLIDCLDFITAAMLTRVQNDVGNPTV